MADEAFSFERLGRQLDWVLRWPRRMWWRLRRWHLRRTCREHRWKESWFWPLDEYCTRCGVSRRKPEWENATIRFDGFMTWDKPSGFVGYGPTWKIEQQEPEQ